MPMYRAIATIPPRAFHTMIRTIEITAEVVSERKAIKEITGLVEGWLDTPFHEDIELTAAPVPTKPNIEDVFAAFQQFQAETLRVSRKVHPANNADWQAAMRDARETLKAKLDEFGFGHLIDFTETE